MSLICERLGIMQLRTMTAQAMLIAVDGHMHWYPNYRLKAAFDHLVSNLDGMTREIRKGQQPVLNMAFLVEGAGCRFFEQLRTGKIDCSVLDAEIVPGSDGLSLMFIQQGVCRLCLIAGKQVVTRERLEILSIGVSHPAPDELPACEMIARIVEHGGIPVLSWSPGKWLFRRGSRVKDLVERARASELAIGDTSLRPRLWPMPRLMRRAMEKGLMLIPGSDPLPLPGEERFMGSYGFVYEGSFDMDQPMSSVRRMLSGDPASIRPAGARNSLPQVVGRLARLRAAKCSG